MSNRRAARDLQSTPAETVPDHVASVLENDIVFESSVTDVQITDDMDDAEKELRFTTKVNWMNPALGLDFGRRATVRERFGRQKPRHGIPDEESILYPDGSPMPAEDDTANTNKRSSSILSRSTSHISDDDEEEYVILDSDDDSHKHSVSSAAADADDEIILPLTLREQVNQASESKKATDGSSTGDESSDLEIIAVNTTRTPRVPQTRSRTRVSTSVQETHTNIAMEDDTSSVIEKKAKKSKKEQEKREENEGKQKEKEKEKEKKDKKEKKEKKDKKEKSKKRKYDDDELAMTNVADTATDMDMSCDMQINVGGVNGLTFGNSDVKAWNPDLEDFLNEDFPMEAPSQHRWDSSANSGKSKNSANDKKRRKSDVISIYDDDEGEEDIPSTRHNTSSLSTHTFPSSSSSSPSLTSAAASSDLNTTVNTDTADLLLDISRGDISSSRAALATFLGGEVVGEAKDKDKGGLKGKSRWEVNVIKCYTCGKFNHTSRNCDWDPSLAPCGICGLPGHATHTNCIFKLCDRCFMPGHSSKNCHNAYSNAERTLCIRCGSPHHNHTECTFDPTHENARYTTQHTRCLACGEYGHISCTLVLGSDKFRQFCVNCGVAGHDSYNCKMPKFNIAETDANVGHVKKGRECMDCGSSDHIAAQCPNKLCFNCGRKGHTRSDCPYRTAQPGNYRRDRAFQMGEKGVDRRNNDRNDRNLHRYDRYEDHRSSRGYIGHRSHGSNSQHGIRFNNNRGGRPHNESYSNQQKSFRDRVLGRIRRY